MLPPPDATGRHIIKQRLGLLVGRVLLFIVLAFLSFGVALKSPQGAPFLQVLGLVLAGGAVVALVALFRAITGHTDLSFDDTGFAIGPRRYGWADALPGFVPLGQNLLRFGPRPPLRMFSTACYPLSTTALAAALNSRLGTLSPPRDAQPDALPVPTARKTLPLPVWGVILCVFITSLLSGPGFLQGAWRLLAPQSYAAHTLDDQDLCNEIGKRNASLLPVLLARAQGGDKYAMYFYGDLFDPEDFICETAVPKDAATAIYWYNKAIALDDQGSERNLGILYERGVGVPQDDNMALYLLEESVTRHNDDIAEVELGKMYARGIGVPQSLQVATSYWQRAAAQGNTDATALLNQYGMQ